MSNPGSQPNSNAWELSHYELHRKPHETVTDSSAIAVSPRALHSELMCPICLDLMKNTLTTKECLHRFCQDCIITALRSGNKECPTCRKKLVSKRSLRPDPNFDSLISKVYPNRDELNEEQEKSQSRRGGVPLKRKRKAPTSGTPSPEHETPDTPQQPEPKRAKASFESETQEITPVPTGHRVNGVELQLRPHPNDPSVADHATRNLSTSAVSTVSHLVKFLSVHTLLDGDKAKGGSAVRALNFEGGCDGSGDRKYMLYISLGEEEEFSILPSGTSLKQVCDTYWTPGDKLKLYFAIDDQLSS